MINVFVTNQNTEFGSAEIGESQPPKKQILVKTDNQSILLYSAKKNSAKVIDEYSTL